MSIVLASQLSASDLILLGNNLRPANGKLHSRRALRRRIEISAVNRSLAHTGERVTRLHRPLLSTPTRGS